MTVPLGSGVGDGVEVAVAVGLGVNVTVGVGLGVNVSVGVGVSVARKGMFTELQEILTNANSNIIAVPVRRAFCGNI